MQPLSPSILTKVRQGNFADCSNPKVGVHIIHHRKQWTMPQDDTNKEQDGPSSTNREPAVRRRDWRDVFTLPGPIRRTFDQFPLVVYQSNDGPLRAPWVRKSHALYIFTTAKDSKKGAPSFNPSCLKWQVSGFARPGID